MVIRSENWAFNWPILLLGRIITDRFKLFGTMSWHQPFLVAKLMTCFTPLHLINLLAVSVTLHPHSSSLVWLATLDPSLSLSFFYSHFVGRYKWSYLFCLVTTCYLNIFRFSFSTLGWITYHLTVGNLGSFESSRLLLCVAWPSFKFIISNQWVKNLIKIFICCELFIGQVSLTLDLIWILSWSWLWRSNLLFFFETYLVLNWARIRLFEWRLEYFVF